MGGKQSTRQNTVYTCWPSSVPSSPSYSYYSVNCIDNDQSKVQSRYTKINDDYHSLEQVREAIVHAGMESSNLILGIDFTKSNVWKGKKSFNGKCLHHLGDSLNPYEQAISIIGRTLSAFDEDGLIPCYGFGDVSTHDRDVFSFYPDSKPCNGFEEVLTRYREIVPNLQLAGPTSFGPIIETAIGIVNHRGGQYHVLVIIADGQVANVDIACQNSTSQNQSTINAIVEASKYPLSIVLVGVGDGPWDMMHNFDNDIPSRTFDNFQFVNFTEIMSKDIPMSQKETEFALRALMEIPSQYKATLDHQLLSCPKETSARLPLPPPLGNTVNCHPNYMQPTEQTKRATGFNYAPSPVSTSMSCHHNKKCSLCLWSNKDLVFGCGHQTCYQCGRDLFMCPICRTFITTRIKLSENEVSGVC
ncbi:E3 ubiquitin-protein ligase RGLG2-like isoform X2 [Carica papaya]|uniref:E3 ubiquitin-protein ligase RGLG2-like isoform X2 n=1 Tax=Carica papaya TaxID=3649 RepID=UPI000B8D1846|nr:E3 ubiquitin-protein ligase RGLG2-like isoform X2 [Carica papaya]